MNTTIDIDPEVWKKFKILAIQRNTTVSDLLATLVEREVKEGEK